MFKVTVMYFNDTQGITPVEIFVEAGSAQEAAEIAVARYENGKTPAGLKLAGAIVRK